MARNIDGTTFGHANTAMAGVANIDDQSLETKCPSDAARTRCPDIYTGSPSPAILE